MKKLIRDKIPEIMLGMNKQPKTHIATSKEYKRKLHEKLREETDEYIEGGAKEEIADILEVIDAICEFNKFDRKEIEIIKEKKQRERGGFRQRIILEIKE